MMHGTIEYEFTLPDGSKRYEIVVERGDIHHFMKMHGAVRAVPYIPETRKDRK